MARVVGNSRRVYTRYNSRGLQTPTLVLLALFHHAELGSLYMPTLMGDGSGILHTIKAEYKNALRMGP